MPSTNGLNLLYSHPIYCCCRNRTYVKVVGANLKPSSPMASKAYAVTAQSSYYARGEP